MALLHILLSLYLLYRAHHFSSTSFPHFLRSRSSNQIILLPDNVFAQVASLQLLFVGLFGSSLISFRRLDHNNLVLTCVGVLLSRTISRRLSTVWSCDWCAWCVVWCLRACKGTTRRRGGLSVREQASRSAPCNNDGEPDCSQV